MSIWDDAVSAADYQAAVMKKKVSKRATEGKSHSLPGPYSKRGAVKEAQVLKDVRTVLAYRNILTRRVEGSGKLINGKQGHILIPSEMTGMPDLIGVMPGGRFLGLEVKAPGGKLSAIQYATLLELQKAGALVAVVCDASRLDAWLSVWLVNGVAYPQYEVAGIPVL